MIFPILLLGLVLRIINLNQSFWLDEAITSTIARDLSLNQIFTQYLPLDNHPPLYLLMIHFIFLIFPNTEIVARIPSVIFGVLLIWVVYFLVRELINKKIANWGALFLATSPLLIYYSQEARMYQLDALLVAAVMFTFIKYLKSFDKKMLFLNTIISAVLIYTDYLPALIFIVTNLIIVIKKKINKYWILSQVMMALSFLPFLPIFSKQFFGGLGYTNISKLLDLIMGKFQFKSLPLLVEKFTLGRIPVPNDVSIIYVLVPVVIFSAILMLGFIKAQKDERIFLSSWLIIPIAVGLILSFFIPVFQFFRFIFVLPPFYILISLGLDSLNKHTKNILVILMIAINLFASALYFSDPSLQRENWKQSIDWVIQHKENGSVLFASSDPFAPYLWYRKDHPEAMGAFRGFYVHNDDRLKLKVLLKEQKKTFIFTYLQDISDPQRKLQNWVEQEDFEKTGAISFSGVGEIWTYERKIN